MESMFSNVPGFLPIATPPLQAFSKDFSQVNKTAI